MYVHFIIQRMADSPYVCMRLSPYNVSESIYTMYETLPRTMYGRIPPYSRHWRPGAWTKKIRFPYIVRNSLKTATLIHDFAIIWLQATDGSFCSAFEAYVCTGSHIQCTYTSRYNVCGSLRTVYGHLPIRCTYEDEYDVRIKLSRNVRCWQKKLKKYTLLQYVKFKEAIKRSNLLTILRIYV